MTEALASNQRKEFQKAMKEEIENLTKQKTWKVKKQSDIPEGVKVIPTTWAFKIKRFPDGSFRSFKSHFCVRGNLQKKEVDDLETYSPVAQWATVRLMLILTVVFNLKTKATDFSNTFAQADMSGEDVYIFSPPYMKQFLKRVCSQAEQESLWTGQCT